MDSVDVPAAMNETERLAVLHDFDILDSLPERDYDDITELASFICQTPISLISFVDSDRQWFKSVNGLSIHQTPRSQSFCAHTIGHTDTLIVQDATADPRFKDNPLVLSDPKIRFYAGAPIVDDGGHVLGTVCVIDTEPRDLSEKQISALEALARHVLVLLKQRTAISELQKTVAQTDIANRIIADSELRLQTFVDTLPALAWIANADGYIYWYNRRWYEYTGATPESMEGWGWQSVHDPAFLPLVMDRWTRSIRERVPFEMVFPLRGTDGVFRSFLTRIIPFHDEAGTLVQWFGTNTEIDELQRTRLSLEENEAVLNQVLTATSDAVVSIARDWTISYLNPMAENLYGASRNLVGKNLWEVFPQGVYRDSPFLEHFHRAMDQSLSSRFEAEYPGPLHRIIGVEVYPSKDGIVIFSRDVTQFKLATAAALQNEKLAAVGRLASSIAHEINNPLESVTNLLYLARHTSETPHIDEYLELADRELRRVAAIANQTLRFYKQTTKSSIVLGSDLFHETLSLYQGRLINSNISVQRRDRATRPILCLEGEIRQVLSNLIGNAIDSMQAAGGRLLLRTREATHPRTGAHGLVITVADTGAGIPPQVRKHIFDAFFSTKGINGTGLGLWISREIVDRHHGQLSMRTAEHPALHGTVFVLFLPYDSPAPCPGVLTAAPAIVTT